MSNDPLISRRSFLGDDGCRSLLLGRAHGGVSCSVFVSQCDENPSECLFLGRPEEVLITEGKCSTQSRKFLLKPKREKCACRQPYARIWAAR